MASWFVKMSFILRKYRQTNITKIDVDKNIRAVYAFLFNKNYSW